MSWFTCCMCKKKVEDIKELDFNRFGLCEVPRDVFNCERTLEVLHLEGNKITELPRTLFQCEELRYLNIGDNEIGNIPPLVSKLTNLQALYLNRNYLSHADISTNMTRCQKLTILDLSSNNLDKVPECLASLMNLQQLYLNDTFIDFLPANFGRLQNLKILELRDNMLNKLPKSLRRLNQLQRLDLSNNELTEIPEVVGSMNNLMELWINCNCITAIDPSVANLKKLIDFDASQNEIQEIPKEIGNWTNITTLVLSHNMISEVPHIIGNLCNLQTLNLEFNFITELPASIGKLINLEELNLQNNCLTNLPSSIGFLRKLVFLVASCNQLTCLPPEIGSCMSLSVLYLHNNNITRLPEEIGHLQKLTTLGLIGNKLDYLPIPVSNLPVLKALWLTQNQSHPLIPLQTECLESTGQLALTCFLLPQIQNTPVEIKSELSVNTVSPTRHICFKEPAVGDEPPPRLTRAPTPYPKDFQRYERSVNNILRKQRELKSHSIDLNLDVSVPQIKEAKVTPMKASISSNEVVVEITSKDNAIAQGENDNDSYEMCCVAPCRNSLVSNDSNLKETYSNYGDVAEETKKPGPPPYYIAAIYSKNAQYFNNIISNDQYDDVKNTLVDKPKHFIQDQPTNILMPQPQHPSGKNSVYQQNSLNPHNHNRSIYLSKNETYLDNDKDERRLEKIKKESSWLFGAHKNARILEISLTPCCYVIGFTVKWNEMGVFVDEVHKDGNAYQKLYPGDKIVVIEDIDLSKMEPEIAAKIVLMRGSEAENITISRSN